MNADGLKSDLQQVLDNDLVLRKEFNELKRSLSDYRNQLIMRDEDCKRLQVTIDVLNTKLAVLERDNSSYKTELASFRELREGIHAQLEEKQAEIDTRLDEIARLKDEVAALSSGYEAAAEQLRIEHADTVRNLTERHDDEIRELRTNTQYRENGIRDEYENRLAEMAADSSEKEQVLLMKHEEVVETLTRSHEMAVAVLTEQHAVMMLETKAASQEEIETLRHELESATREFDTRLDEEVRAAAARHTEEVRNLTLQLEVLRAALTSQFEANLEALSTDYTNREAALREAYESQLATLNGQLTSQAAEMAANFESRINAMSATHDEILTRTTTEYESRIADLVNEYEAKLSNTLIHSTSQNSRLNEELDRTRSEHERVNELITDLHAQLAARDGEVAAGAERIGELELMLRSEADRFLQMETEYNAFRESALMSTDEKVAELNNQIVTLNQSHSEYVAELCARIDELGTEIRNLGVQFETASNQLGETEGHFERACAELESAKAELAVLRLAAEEQQSVAERFRTEIQAQAEEAIAAKELEYQKLLVENTSLIDEIDKAQDKIEAQDAELDLLRTELQELKMISAGKTQDFKEALSQKNFELTSLEANNMALRTELDIQNEKLNRVQEELAGATEKAALVDDLRNELQSAVAKAVDAEASLAELQGGLLILNSAIQSLNNRIAEKDSAIADLEAIVENRTSALEARLEESTRQLNALNDEKLALLEEKDQMAGQLLKMNEVIGNLSQQVEAEQIDVSGLNYHRKNVILAGNSAGNADSSPMKKQINELVREIDKCIALLSA